MTILMLFEKFSAKFCLNFLTLILNALPNVMHFVRTFSIMHAYGVRRIVFEEARNYGKNVCIKNIFQNGWWEEAYPSSYLPRSTPGHELQKPSKGYGIF